MKFSPHMIIEDLLDRKAFLYLPSVQCREATQKPQKMTRMTRMTEIQLKRELNTQTWFVRNSRIVLIYAVLKNVINLLLKE